jgi:hypothetical protein
MNESGKKRLRDAQRTVEFLLGMVADLLDLHRIETGEPQIVYSRSDLACLIEASANRSPTKISFRVPLINYLDPG